MVDRAKKFLVSVKIANIVTLETVIKNPAKTKNFNLVINLSIYSYSEAFKNLARQSMPNIYWASILL